MDMKTRQRLARFCLFLAVPIVLPGCTSYSEVREIAPVFKRVAVVDDTFSVIESNITNAANVVRKDPVAALGNYVASAKAASEILARNPGDERTRSDYNFAVARILSTIREAKLDPWNQPMAIPGGFELAAKPDPRPNWKPALYDFTPADQFDLGGSYVKERTTRDGLGAPAVAVGKGDNQDAARNFTMQRVYYGVTAIARFKGNRCEIGFEDPLATDTVQALGHTFPLAADYTVPLAVMLAANDPQKLELMRVFRPAEYAETAKVISLQPYDPNKTVVLCIHGLKDSQATWTPLINTLRGDPEIRKHYQFWFYTYPSGYPYPYSAAILREKLDAIEKRYPVKKPMVVIGHSMGGCISRLLITDTGDKLWKGIFKSSPQESKFSPHNKRLLEESLIFKHRPDVGRVIFIAAPLRGSDLATNWIGRLGSRLVKAPTTLLEVGKEVSSVMTWEPGDLQIKQIPNSIDTLSPNNKMVKAINTIPITPGIPYHTIVGDRGKGNGARASDGVVPYWSSHLDGARSELVVPSGHGAHQNPQAIAEVRRILKENLRHTTL
ncbi:MAG: hypothetical protein QM755_24750 [Luteolibacter sp.]